MPGQSFDFPLIQTRIFISWSIFTSVFLRHLSSYVNKLANELSISTHAQNLFTIFQHFSLQSRDRYGYCIITCPWQTYEINQLFINCIEQNIKMFLDPASWNWWCFIYTQHIAGGDLALTATHRINPVPVTPWPFGGCGF